jgi:hypothetical protein
MGLSLSLEPSLRLELSTRLTLRQTLGETFGDIPVYSLHRIKNQMQKHPIGINENLTRMLVRNLLLANKEYKEETDNDWNCLTSNNLINAFEWMNKDVSETIEGIMNCPQEHKERMLIIKEKFQKEWDGKFEVIKQWFWNHYEDLLYNTASKIPWSIIQRLRSGLSLWISKQGNIFDLDIEEMIMKIAEESGKKCDNAEKAWKALGGKLFR